ncbi:MAG TPA: hypothetical protein DCQ32_01685, partial [Cyanobacteria bacterium UBA8156]|nr:hypothetical protein [Cyanobacteria bacterium UBA8156]
NREWRNLEPGAAWGAIVGGVGGSVGISLVFLAAQGSGFWLGAIALAMAVAAPILMGVAFRRSRHRGWPALWLLSLLAAVGLLGVGTGLLLTGARLSGAGAIALGFAAGAWSLTQPQLVRRRWQQQQKRAIPP